MKILLCVWRLTHGGAERVASMWAKGFVQEGLSVDFLLGSYSSPVTYEVPSESNIYYECALNDKIATKIIPQFIKTRKIRHILKKSNPDVVICVLPQWGMKIKKAMKGLRQVPIIITEHNSYERPASAPMKKIQYEQKFATNKLFDAVTVLTQADKDFLTKKMGADFTSNTYVLPNPVSFVPVQNIPDKEESILAAGRLNAWHYKGFDLLIDAWSQIAFKYPNWKLKIAGDGNPEYLQKIINEKKIASQVDLLGFVDMLEQYQKASIFVLSSRYEGFGMVLTEAMSQGCACVACDYKGRQREIITNEKEGLLCSVEDVDALASCIEKMILDERYRHECQMNAVKRSKCYLVSEIVNKWMNIFDKLNIR
ncbi:glycosyltransferase family 4 protein [uncultured Fibrobacter sp.]|uniref:glycosyltransferase family 4 protein n=1 Tax=uncultured Fibrobacter sp. TaxID=261512 RepID=UPI0026285E62|nr:glycosyltransferase family 4 protein [uncultured Fibrobacter sp.]